MDVKTKRESQVIQGDENTIEIQLPAHTQPQSELDQKRYSIQDGKRVPDYSHSAWNEISHEEFHTAVSHLTTSVPILFKKNRIAGVTLVGTRTCSVNGFVYGLVRVDPQSSFANIIKQSTHVLAGLWFIRDPHPGGTIAIDHIILDLK
jgi:hypothetical protein